MYLSARDFNDIYDPNVAIEINLEGETIYMPPKGSASMKQGLHYDRFVDGCYLVCEYDFEHYIEWFEMTFPDDEEKKDELIENSVRGVHRHKIDLLAVKNILFLRLK